MHPPPATARAACRPYRSRRPDAPSAPPTCSRPPHAESSGNVSPKGSRYLHGTDPREQARLARLNDLINRASLAKLGLPGGGRILEVGSGLGQFARAMARLAGPPGRGLGIERSPEQLRGAMRAARGPGEARPVERGRGEPPAPP